MISVDLLFLGHFARDIIEVNGVKEVMAGGGIYYGGVAAIVAGASIAVVTRYKRDDEAMIEPLKAAGARVFPAYSDSTSGIHNVYTDPTMETRLCYPLGFAGLIQENDIPDIDCKRVVISPIVAGEIDMALLKFLHGKHPGKIALDIQGFIRVREGADIVFKDWPEKREGMRMIRVLKCDAAEAKAMTGHEELRPALDTISSWGPEEILLTHNKGATVYSRGEEWFYPWKARSMAGRTGRGDTCFASYNAFRLTKDVDASLKYAVAATSIKMETPGPLAASKETITRKSREWFG